MLFKNIFCRQILYKTYLDLKAANNW